MMNPPTHCKSLLHDAKTLATVCGALTGDETEHVDETMPGCLTANCISPNDLTKSQ